MSKKLMTGLLALVAFAALALPAAASATSPELTNAAGATVTAKTPVTAVNTGATKFKGSFGEVSCSSADLAGEVFKNEGKGGAVEGTISSASFTGTSGDGTECTSTFGVVKVTTAPAGGTGTPWCMRAVGAGDVLEIRGNSCANAARTITYRLDFTELNGGTECNYERTTATGPVKGTFLTAPNDAEGTILTGANSEFKGESGNSIWCPGSGSLEMTFDLELVTAQNGSKTLTIS